MLQDYPITGVVHSKPIEKKQGKKDPTKTWEFQYLILEIVSTKEFERQVDDQVKTQRITKPELIKFELARGLNISHIDPKDKVNISFKLIGQEYTTKEGKQDIITKVVIDSIRHADIDVAKEKSDKPFEPIAPGKVFDVDKEEDDSLPFILTIPITLSIALQLFPF